MKAIICMFIPQPPLCPTFAFGEFYWSPTHKCHVWGGQTRKPIELSIPEFNKLADKLLHEHDFFGKRTVRLIEDAAVAVTPPPADPPAPAPSFPQLLGPIPAGPQPEEARYTPLPEPYAEKRKRGVRKRSRRAHNKELV